MDAASPGQPSESRAVIRLRHRAEAGSRRSGSEEFAGTGPARKCFAGAYVSAVVSKRQEISAIWTLTLVDHRLGTPTVKPIADFEPRQDAEALRKAMKGFGTDDEALINILCYRSNFQRLEIAKMFKTLFGRDLIQDIKSETSGNFRELLVALLSRPTEYYAKQLHKAVKGLGTDEKCIIEIMCSLNNQQIRNVREVYEELFKSSLEEDLVDDTSGYFRRLLRSLCTARRNESREIDVEKAKLDAERLHEAGELHLGTDEAVFNEILASRSYPQLLQIFTEYETLTGNTIEKAIENEFSGSIKGALLAIVQCARSKINFYAERLYKSMKGLGTDDKALIRLVVTHCEVDMVEIKESFLSHYEETLEAFIEDDTSGNYRRALIALVKDEAD